MNNMIGNKMTRKQIEEFLCLSGKECTSEIKKMICEGRLQFELSYINPFETKKMERTYFFVAKQLRIEDE